MKKIFYIVLAGLVLFSCKQKKENAAGASQPALPETLVTVSPEAMLNAGITTGYATMENLQIPLKVNGLVDVPPESLVSISFPFGGFLKSTQLLPGRKVVKGQVLGIMEDQSYVQLQQDYLVALAKLELLQSDFKRQSDLRQGEASSKKVFETAKAEFEMQQVMVKGLSEKLKILGIVPESLNVEKVSSTVPIRSPISGFVKSVFVNVGKYVNPSDVLFEIVDPDHIHGSLVVFEKDQHLVKPGQQLIVVNPARPEKTYRGEVILVSKNVDSSRGIVVHCHFIGDHADLIPGMYISAEIKITGQLLPMVPEEAVVRHEGKSYVFQVSGKGEYRLTEVTVGEPKDGKVALTANYKDWTQTEIVLSGAYALLGKLKNVEED